jgi:hypothetical protein
MEERPLRAITSTPATIISADPRSRPIPAPPLRPGSGLKPMKLKAIRLARGRRKNYGKKGSRCDHERLNRHPTSMSARVDEIIGYNEQGHFD